MSTDALDRLLEYLERPGSAETIDKLIRLLENLEESGILDLLLALTSREVIERLTTLIITTGTLKALDNIDKIMGSLGRAASALTEQADHSPSLGELLTALRDPEVRRGLARLIAALKELGKPA